MSDEGAALRGWLIAAAAQLPESALERTFNKLTPARRRCLQEAWEPVWAHPGQEAPPGDWRVWVMMAGRGFGKTRTGSEWVTARMRDYPGARIALVAATLDEGLRVMVRGESGLERVALDDGERPVWLPGAKELRWPNGTRAFLYSGAGPDGLRGPEHHFAWCDELAKWRYAQESWDNLMLGLRLGDAPRVVVTTTPRTLAALTRIIGDGEVRRTGGRTDDNPHLAASFREAMRKRYGGTRLGRQELDGVLLTEPEGSLWKRDLLEACRLDGPAPEMERVVIGVDPPASAGGDACGIVACGAAGGIGYVLGDHSGSGLSPQGWAAKVAAAAELWGADRVIAEANNGGDMVRAVLEGAEVTLPVRIVHASRGKVARAEPIAARFEQGKVKLAGCFPELEDELAGMVAGGDYEGPGRSPDRADAMVWALSELMLGRRGTPGVRGI